MSGKWPGRASDADLILAMKGISKSYPGVKALHDVDFDVRRGEVHALVGENGAGKSTLIKILSGAIQKDCGSITIDGHPVEIQSPRHAQKAGIGTIYQEFSLTQHMSVEENIFLGREPTSSRLGTIDYRGMRSHAQEIIRQLGANISPDAKVRDLSVSEQQLVEIAKVLSINSKIIIMDEPTAALSAEETRNLFGVIRTLTTRGVSIIYISHRLDEIFEVAQRATVLKDGRKVGTVEVSQVEPKDLVRMMVGQSWEETSLGIVASDGEEVLRVVDLSDGLAVHNVSFSIRRGETLGITGAVGSGKTELARAIFGASSKRHGSVYLDGVKVDIRSPQHAVRLGIGYLSEDRKRDGLNLGLTVPDNIVLSALRKVCRFGVLRGGARIKAASHYIQDLDIQGAGPSTLAGTLSGGNQQKVALAKWLFAGCKLIIFDEPTRGIDVGAKAEVHKLIRNFAASGGAAVVISSDIDEILRVATRILVMHRGRVVAELQRSQATKEQILHMVSRG